MIWLLPATRPIEGLVFSRNKPLFQATRNGQWRRRVPRRCNSVATRRGWPRSTSCKVTGGHASAPSSCAFALFFILARGTQGTSALRFRQRGGARGPLAEAAAAGIDVIVTESTRGVSWAGAAPTTTSVATQHYSQHHNADTKSSTSSGLDQPAVVDECDYSKA